MKLTEKYCLCDMCSKTVGHLEDDKMAKFLYITNIRTLIENERFEKDILYSGDLSASNLFDILKGTQEKYLCTECRGNLYKSHTLKPFLMNFKSKSEREFPLSADIALQTIHFNTIEFTGFKTDGRIEFAESKNRKLAQVYFAGLNLQIEEMLKEEN